MKTNYQVKCESRIFSNGVGHLFYSGVGSLFFFDGCLDQTQSHDKLVLPNFVKFQGCGPEPPLDPHKYLTNTVTLLWKYTNTFVTDLVFEKIFTKILHHLFITTTETQWHVRSSYTMWGTWWKHYSHSKQWTVTSLQTAYILIKSTD